MLCCYNLVICDWTRGDPTFPTSREEMTLVTFEALPFLTAVIDEGLSFSFGVASRLPRIFPLTGFQYGNYHLPVGIRMSSYMVYTDEKIFPDSFTFNSDR